MRNYTLGIVGIIGTALLLWTGYSMIRPESNQAADVPRIGYPAPDFEAKNFSTGEVVRLTDYRGKTVILNFWASWCLPCQEEIPSFQKVFEKYSEYVIVLGINAGEGEEQIEPFQKANRLSFPLLLDPNGDVSRKYLVSGLPTTYFIDANGKIHSIHIGSMYTTDLEAEIQSIEALK